MRRDVATVLFIDDHSPAGAAAQRRDGMAAEGGDGASFVELISPPSPPCQAASIRNGIHWNPGQSLLGQFQNPCYTRLLPYAVTSMPYHAQEIGKICDDMCTIAYYQVCLTDGPDMGLRLYIKSSG